MSVGPGGLSASIRQQLADGRSIEEIVNDLVAGGLSRTSAQRFVDREMAATPPPAPDATSAAAPQGPAQIWQGEPLENIAPRSRPAFEPPSPGAFRTLGPKIAWRVIAGIILVGVVAMLGTFESRRQAAGDQALQALLDE